MNKLLKRISLALIFTRLFICVYELILLYTYGISIYYSKDIAYKITGMHLYAVCIELCKTILCYLIVEVIDYKLHTYTCDTHEHPEHAIVQDDSNSIDNYISRAIMQYKSLVVVYMCFLVKLLPHFNIWLFLICPYAIHKLHMCLYSKYKYKKIFLYPVIQSLIQSIFLLTKIAEPRMVSTKHISNEILDFFTSRKYDLQLYHIKSNYYNVGVTKVFNHVIIYFFGDVLSKFSKKELTAILYHEIGHVVNNSLMYRTLVGKTISISMYLLEFCAMRKNKKLYSQIHTSQSILNNYVMLYSLIQISIAPICAMVCNHFYQIDEIEADRYSYKKYGKQHLIGSLIKLTCLNECYSPISYLYSLLVATHPALTRRIKIINQF